MPFQIIRNDITKVEGANKMFLFGSISKKLELNQTRYFTTARKELNSILDFITEALASSGMDPKACSRTRFRSEDLTVMLMDHASEGSRLKVTVRKTLGATTVRMVCGGRHRDSQRQSERRHDYSSQAQKKTDADSSSSGTAGDRRWSCR